MHHQRWNWLLKAYMSTVFSRKNYLQFLVYSYIVGGDDVENVKSAWGLLFLFFFLSQVDIYRLFLHGNLKRIRRFPVGDWCSVSHLMCSLVSAWDSISKKCEVVVGLNRSSLTWEVVMIPTGPLHFPYIEGFVRFGSCVSPSFIRALQISGRFSRRYLCYQV